MEQAGEKWVAHYSSDHEILLVGEGDFSFSLSLALSFGSASNIVATSLDSYAKGLLLFNVILALEDDVTKKYKNAKSNLNKLRKLGACLLHGVDATKMKLHSDLKMRRFDRVIFNFPHAGFYGKEDNVLMINMHKGLVRDFFMNASRMLRANGEVHVSHKTGGPFSKWDIEELAAQSSLTLVELADFKKDDYPGYNNKRGDGGRCDEPFRLGKCSTFKFIHDPRATGKLERRNRSGSRQQPMNPAFREMHDAWKLLPTASVDLNYYPQPSHISELTETTTTSLFGIFSMSNGYTSPITGGYLNHLNNVVHRITPPFAAYPSRGMISGPRRLLQPLQPKEQLESFQPRPTSTNVRYSLEDQYRTRDIFPLSLGARNEGYRGSNYLPEAHGGTSQSASYYSCDRVVKPEFESYISEQHWRDLNGDNYVLHRELPRISSFE